MNKTIISVDAMGGDNAPDIVIEGASLALEKDDSIKYRFFGNEKKILNLIDRFPNLKKSSDIINCDSFIAMDEKPSQALKSGRNSSMAKAIKDVKAGNSKAVVSAGNTGAYMVFSKIILGCIPLIQRPAIQAVLPTKSGHVVILDVGANLECNSTNLVQFAFMSSVLCKSILGIEKPRIGVLNIGSEDIKGHDHIRKAHQSLSNIKSLNYTGFIEPDEILNNAVEIVVADGFTGNVIIKTLEGASNFFTKMLRHHISNSALGKLTYLFGKSSFSNMKKHLDPRMYNGAVFLGLNHTAVKSHGGTDAIGFENAIKVTKKIVDDRVCERINEEISSITPEMNLSLSNK